MGALRDVSVAAGAAVAGAVAAWWLLSVDTAAPEVALDVPEPVPVVAPASPAPPPVVAPTDPAPVPVAEPPAPADAREAALRAVATVSGHGLLQCDVTGLLDDGPVSGLERGLVVDGVLTAAVSEAMGEARLHRPGEGASAPPAVVVRWWDAWPAETGGCEVIPPTRVQVSGTVVLPDGTPAPMGEVGNLVDGIHRIGEGGRFTVSCWLGATCPIAARHDRRSGWGPFVKIVPDGAPIDDLEIVLEAPAEQPDLVDYLKEELAERDRLARQADPLEVALEDLSLDAEARTIVERWKEERDIRLADERASMASLLAAL